MGFTKNWKKLNLLQSIALNTFYGRNANAIQSFPFVLQVKDGTSYQPKYGTNVNSTGTRNCQHPYAQYGVFRYNVNSSASPQGALGGFSLAIGSGTTPFSEDDYCLENEIITIDNSSRTGARSNNIAVVFSSYEETSCIMEICGTNNSNTAWNINEVGVYSWIMQPSSTTATGSNLNIKNCLIFREVLSNTLVVEPNQSYSIKFQLSY